MNALPFQLLILPVLLIATPPGHADTADKTLEIFWIDSEGGGSTLIVTPERESVLVDTGNPGGRDSRRIHKVATELAGLKRQLGGRARFASGGEASKLRRKMSAAARKKISESMKRRYAAMRAAAKK